MVLRNVYNDATTLQRHFGLTPALVRANVRQLFDRMEVFKSAVKHPIPDGGGGGGGDGGETPVEEVEQGECGGEGGLDCFAWYTNAHRRVVKFDYHFNTNVVILGH